MRLIAGDDRLSVTKRNQMIQASAKDNNVAILDILLKDQNPDREVNQAFQTAARGGLLEVVERLLAAGADVNAAASISGRTALQAAADSHLEVFERLFTAGADVNAAASISGRTALQAAAGGGHLDVVERLLTAGADVNAVAAEYNEGGTALQAAAEGGYLEIVERLMQAGVQLEFSGP